MHAALERGFGGPAVARDRRLAGPHALARTHEGIGPAVGKQDVGPRAEVYEPRRCPAASRSPTATHEAMRRATSPAAWTTTTGPALPSIASRRRLFSSAPGRKAGRKGPAMLSSAITVPATGLRVTCTLCNERKVLTRVASSPGIHGSRTRSTPTTVPSAGA